MAYVNINGRHCPVGPTNRNESLVMTEKTLCQYCVLNQRDQERNRMYPPRYRKESPMTKLTMAHLDAVCHAEFYLHKAAVQFLEPHMRSQLDDDLLRLAELKMRIIKQIAVEPELFDSKDKPDGDSNHTR